MLRKEKGITLVALVITVIVLLILAGVSIAALTGNQTNIITGAQKAKNDYTDAANAEEKTLDNLTQYFNQN